MLLGPDFSALKHSMIRSFKKETKKSNNIIPFIKSQSTTSQTLIGNNKIFKI